MTDGRPAGSFGLAGFWAAMGFLTVCPVPEALAERGRSRASIFFPCVGALLGVVTAGVAHLPVDPVVGGVLAVSVLFVATGGLHWDGWSDVLDAGVPPGLARARRLEILADPRVGAHAVVGTVLALLLAVWALGRAPFWDVVAGSIVARWMMVMTLRWAPTLKSSGAAVAMRTDARPLSAAAGALGLTGLAVAASGTPGLSMAAAGCGLAVGVVLAFALSRRFGGLNGDGHGAVGLVTELTVWVVAGDLVGVGL